MSPNRRNTDAPQARRRRMRTLVWGVLGALGFAVLVALAVYTWSAQSSRVDDIARLTRENARLTQDNAEQTRAITAQRRESLIVTCRRDRKQNRAIIGYLADLGADRASLDRATRFFPVHRNCVAEANARTRTP